ncbi:Surfactin synthase thioesterase subunit [Micromonospora nigra]|uniref:Surfactin synthase thioesterase subunit n=1 Tax=Micromonospora nigra TaxID=145857 RepID=A0A1C6RCE4_9ACTN|nr:alpha/beta fold hydrolase [Micromonospora nigra]SCL14813.1 Surfactin synthase thioesterase subunit [Micromonospora nigra]
MVDWLIRLGEPPSGGRRPRLRIIALPHAGGWPTAFRPWRSVLPEDVELLVGQLPGRGRRVDEPSLRQVDPLVDGLARAVADLDPAPYVVVGHSFGSVLGYELTRAMERRGRPPRLLVVSARQPPSFPSEPPFAHLHSDADLLAHLLEIGGMAPEWTDRPDFVRLVLAAVRADLEAMETYRRPLSGTDVPILSLGAHDDPVVVADRLHLWSLETTGAFHRLMFTGGHFYLYEPAVAATVAQHLETLRVLSGRLPRNCRTPRR